MGRSQGANANAQGVMNKVTVANILLSHQYADIGPIRCKGNPTLGLQRFDECHRQQLEASPNVFAKTVPIGIKRSGEPYKADFLAKRHDWPSPLAIMTRTQGTSGTAWEKNELMFANLSRALCRSIVILTGDKMPEFAYQEAEEWRQRTQGKIGRVFRSLDEFRRWVTDGAPYPAMLEQALLLDI